MKYSLIVLSALAFLFISQKSNAQSGGIATINEAGILQIPTDAPIQSSYVFDLSGLTFENEGQLSSFLNERACDLFVFRSMFDQNKGVLFIQKKRHPEWSAEQWNAVLQENLSSKPLIQ